MSESVRGFDREVFYRQIIANSQQKTTEVVKFLETYQIWATYEKDGFFSEKFPPNW